MIYAPVMFFAPTVDFLPGHICDDGRPATIKTGAEGPDDGLGVLATGCRGTFDLCVDMEQQEWTQLGDLWVGVDRRGQLTTEMVARDRIYSGHPVTICGQIWQIPVALATFGRCGLPQTRVLGKDGRGEWRVRDAYKDLCDKARIVWDIRSGERTDGLSADDLDDLAGACLSVNYRIGKLDMLALGLLDNQSVRDLIDALLDWPTLRDVLKKKATPD